MGEWEDHSGQPRKTPVCVIEISYGVVEPWLYPQTRAR